MNLQILRCVYSIVLKDFLGAKHREIIGIKDLRMLSCRTIAARGFAINYLVVLAEVVIICENLKLDYTIFVPHSCPEAKLFSVRQQDFKKIQGEKEEGS